MKMSRRYSTNGRAVRVRWLRAALTNLEDEGEYIDEDNEAAATEISTRIRSDVQRLSKHPAMGRPGRVAGTRELVVAGTPYVIPYRVRVGVIEILRVCYGARKWPGKFDS